MAATVILQQVRHSFHSSTSRWHNNVQHNHCTSDPSLLSYRNDFAVSKLCGGQAACKHSWQQRAPSQVSPACDTSWFGQCWDSSRRRVAALQLCTHNSGQGGAYCGCCASNVARAYLPQTRSRYQTAATEYLPQVDQQPTYYRVLRSFWQVFAVVSARRTPLLVCNKARAAVQVS